MKLAAKYNRVTLIASFFVLLFTGLVYYTVIHFILTSKLDRDLAIEEDEITEYVKTYGKLPIPGSYKDQKVSYTPADIKKIPERKYAYNDYIDESKGEKEPGRSLITFTQVGGQLYQVIITKSRVEAEDLIRIIFLITLGVTIILLVTLILINRFVLNNLWKPFFAVLEQMKAFNLADKHVLEVQNTKIDEFIELNEVSISMSLRATRDYGELKSFTDNASHEMMTPLAIMNSKLDTLIQTGTFTHPQGELIEDIYTAVGRLSRLSQSLLLLAKIENNLIIDLEPVNLKDLILQKLRQLKELLNAKGITVNQELEDKKININKYLADMLISNLLSNAIRHNHNQGTICLQLNDENLIIANTSDELRLISNKAFERFYKNPSSEGSGLGLAISKQICTLYQFDLEYRYQDLKHIFTISFK